MHFVHKCVTFKGRAEFSLKPHVLSLYYLGCGSNDSLSSTFCSAETKPLRCVSETHEHAELSSLHSPPHPERARQAGALREGLLEAGGDCPRSLRDLTDRMPSQRPKAPLANGQVRDNLKAKRNVCSGASRTAVLEWRWRRWVKKFHAVFVLPALPFQRVVSLGPVQTAGRSRAWFKRKSTTKKRTQTAQTGCDLPSFLSPRDATLTQSKGGR